jgi:hypothetical protein
VAALAVAVEPAGVVVLQIVREDGGAQAVAVLEQEQRRVVAADRMQVDCTG